MAKAIIDKIIKMRLKLLKAWVKGKTDKAIKLQHKILEEELKRRSHG